MMRLYLDHELGWCPSFMTYYGAIEKSVPGNLRHYSDLTFSSSRGTDTKQPPGLTLKPCPAAQEVATGREEGRRAPAL